MKTKKGLLFFLFLCVMGVIMVTIPSSQAMLGSDYSVYANNEEDEEEEEEESLAPTSGSNGNYENLQIPSMMSTAYADGLRMAQQSDGEGDAEIFFDNVNAILTKSDPHQQTYARFDTLGILIGPVNSVSGSSTNDVASTLSLSLEQLKDNYSFGKDIGESYWTFGRAVHNLRVDAGKADTSTIAGTAAVSAVSNVPRNVTNLGVRLLKEWNPAPVVLAFSDSSVIHQSKYASNRLVEMVRNNDTLLAMVGTLGGPVPGIPQISLSQLVVLVVMMLGLSVSILSILLGDRFFSVSARKALVKVFVMIIAVPLTMRAYDWGLEVLDDTVNSDNHSAEHQIARSHLLLGQWAEKGFALPSDVELEVQDGRFILTRPQIRAINGLVVGSDDDEVIAEEILNQVNADNNQFKMSWQPVMTQNNKDREGQLWRTNTVLSMAKALGNNEPIEILNAGYVYGSGLRSGKRANGNFMFTHRGGYVEPENNVSQRYRRFGLTPIATYNLLNTSFNSSGLSVNSNLSSGVTIPTVAPTAYGYSTAHFGSGTDGESAQMSGLLKFAVEMTLFFASIKALVKIITHGFGGMVHGGATSMFGSSAGWGELFGAIFATIFGVIGLSLFSVVTYQVADSLYGTVHAMVGSFIDGSTILSTTTSGIAHFLSPTSFLSYFPFVSDPVTGWLEGGIVSIVAGFMALFVLPKFVRIPIETFSVWVATLPSTFAQKAQLIENRFTNDATAGGRSTGAFSGAVDKAEQGMINSGKAVAAGGGLLAGAMIKAGGGAIANKFGSGSGKKDDSKKVDGQGTSSDSVAGITSSNGGKNEGENGTGDNAKIDENGNIINDTINDNDNINDDDQTMEDGNTSEEQNIEGENNVNESATVDNQGPNEEVSTNENAAINEQGEQDNINGDDINASESVVSDNQDTLGDTTTDNNESINEQGEQDNINGDNINADESVVSDNQDTLGDTTTDNNQSINEQGEQDNINGDNTNTNESVVSDNQDTIGDVNTDSNQSINEQGEQSSINDSNTNTNESINSDNMTNDSGVHADNNTNTNESINADNMTNDSGVHADSSQSINEQGEQGNESINSDNMNTSQGPEGSLTNDSTLEGNHMSNDSINQDSRIDTDNDAAINQTVEDSSLAQGDQVDNQQVLGNDEGQGIVNNHSEGGKVSENGGISISSTGDVNVGDGSQSNTSGGSKVSGGGQSGTAGQSNTSGGSKVSGGGQSGTAVDGGQSGTSGQSGTAGGTGGTKVSGGGQSGKAGGAGGSKVSGGGQSGTAGGTGGTKVSGGGQSGTQQGRPTISQTGNVSLSSTSQANSGRENTATKASRISNLFGGGQAQQGNVSNAKQAAVGAVHMMGGLTGMQDITQKNVDKLRHQQGHTPKDTSNPNPSGPSATNHDDRVRQQQIIDTQRLNQEHAEKRNKKPSFISQIRDQSKQDR